MQGMAAQAQKENNSSLIWGLVRSLWKGLTLHWTLAAALNGVLERAPHPLPLVSQQEVGILGAVPQPWDSLR